MFKKFTLRGVEIIVNVNHIESIDVVQPEKKYCNLNMTSQNKIMVDYSEYIFDDINNLSLQRQLGNIQKHLTPKVL